MVVKFITSSFAILFLLAGCGNAGGKLGKNTNEDILEKYQNCTLSEPSGTYAMTCENVVKECKRRKTEGNNACKL